MMQPLMSEADLDRTLAEAQAVGDFVIIEWSGLRCCRCHRRRRRCRFLPVKSSVTADAAFRSRYLGGPGIR
eukprot:SM013741S00082  [mRNA]  locus=s13741:38:265:- [translate_table: standard]